MRLIISDSTTVITLLNINRLDVLTNVFSCVYIPTNVYEEITTKEKITLDEEFFITKDIKDKKLYNLLLKSLDKGEAQAIVLAKETNLSLIIDEKKGRKIATTMGINIFGFIGLLIINHKNKLLSKKDTIVIFNKAKEYNFRVSKKLENDFLELLED